MALNKAGEIPGALRFLQPAKPGGRSLAGQRYNPLNLRVWRMRVQTTMKMVVRSRIMLWFYARFHTRANASLMMRTGRALILSSIQKR